MKISPTCLGRRLAIGQAGMNLENNRYKKPAHMTCLINTISQPSFDMAAIKISPVSKEGRKSERRSEGSGKILRGFLHDLSSGVRLLRPQMTLAYPVQRAVFNIQTSHDAVQRDPLNMGTPFVRTCYPVRLHGRFVMQPTGLTKPKLGVGLPIKL